MEAAQQYSQYVTDLVAETTPAATPSSSDYRDLLITDNNGIRTVTFNRPAKYNAFNLQMYKDFTQAINAASSDNAVKAAMITGAGKYYSSGNDINNFTKALGPDTTPQQVAAESRILLRYNSMHTTYMIYTLYIHIIIVSALILQTLISFHILGCLLCM